MQLTYDQKVAYDLVADWVADEHSRERFFCLGGAAGTGKTTLLGKLADEVLTDDVTWTATTGKAAQRLAEVAHVPAGTLHSALFVPPSMRDDGAPVFDTLQPAPEGIAVVEEASMISPDIYEHLETWAESGTRVLFVGDPYQLPPVIGEAVAKKYGKDFTVFMEHPGPVLTQVMRSTRGVVSVATSIRDDRKVPTISTEAYAFRNGPHLSEAVDNWLKDRDDHVLITWRNALRTKLNTAVRQRNAPRDVVARRSQGLPMEGERILFRKNADTVRNGMLGTVRAIEPGPALDGIQTFDVTTEHGTTRVTCCGREAPMDGGAPMIRDWEAYKVAVVKAARAERTRPKWPVPITFGYALTAHAAQGSEWDRVTVGLTPRDLDNKFFWSETLLPNGDTMPFALRWLYTAVTRARTHATVIIGPE